VSPVKYGLGFYIPEDDILHSHRCENLKQCIQNRLTDGDKYVCFAVSGNHFCLKLCEPRGLVVSEGLETNGEGYLHHFIVVFGGTQSEEHLSAVGRFTVICYHLLLVPRDYRAIININFHVSRCRLSDKDHLNRELQVTHCRTQASCTRRDTALAAAFKRSYHFVWTPLRMIIITATAANSSNIYENF
jgi:hypothetical protein